MRAILLAGGLSLIFTLLGTRYAIRVLTTKGYGQLIRDDGPTTHHTKRGTPTMGGLVIILSVVFAYLLAKLITQDVPSWSGLLLLFLLVGLGTVGFLDDYIKVAKQRSLGLRSKAKIAGQTIVAVVFGCLALTMPDSRGQTPASRHLSFIRDFDNLTLPAVLVVLLILVMISGSSNAVNLTDGLDGLATGASTMVFGAYTLVNIWQNNQWCALNPGNKCYDVRDPLDLAAIAAALTGACFGFLWWNASPAKIFMGDTGSLALGGTLAGLAILTRTEFLLAVLGGLFVIQTLSVILQVGYFKLDARQTNVPDGAAAPSLRAEGMGRDHGRDPVLDHHRHLRGRRAGHLLRRVGHGSMKLTLDLDALQPHERLVGCARGRARHRCLRVRGRRQPDPPRRAGHRARRVRERRAAREGDAARGARRGRPHRRGRERRPARRRRPAGHLAGRAADAHRPSSPRRARGVPVWGEVELAWRLRDPEHPGVWLCVTGTNGKTTTVQMLDTILRAGGLNSIACGNVGLPIVEAVMDPAPYAVYAVELSSFQLHYTSSMSAHAAAVLNVAEDHLDWYSGPPA